MTPAARTSHFTYPLLALAMLLLLAALPLQLAAQSNDDCMACHSDKDLSMEKKGRTISLFVNPSTLKASPHRKSSCVSCHIGFSAEDVPHKENITPVKCTTCHQNAVQKHQFHGRMLLEQKKQGKLEAACKDCHGTHDVVPVKGGATQMTGLKQVDACAKCHSDATAHFKMSAHGDALAKGVKGAPTCISCHSLDIVPHEGTDPLKIKIAQEQLCLSCHLDNPDVRAKMTASKNFISSYEKSVHSIALHKKGDAKAANCVDCHGSHEMAKSIDPKSTVFKQNIPTLCAKCHGDIAKEYNESIHGVALLRGNKDAPNCTDCHGEHDILDVKNPNSPVASQNVSAQVCTPCHSSLKLSEKWGFKPGKAKTFNDSYHGLALRGGSLEAANCASCHGVHNIKPSTDPTSTIHKSNLAATCGSCHPGAGERFAQGSVHVGLTDQEDPLLSIITTVYIILIIVVIGGMFAHNVLDFFRKATHKLKIRRGHYPEPEAVHRLYVRMTLSERLQHGTMALSFMVLVISGFMLSYPEAWWVQYLRGLSESAFTWRSNIHRIAGVVLVAISLVHTWYIIFTARGRKLVSDLWFRLSDITDMIAVLKYNLGISPTKPRFDRFSYIEKSEYWALVWGTMVMALTGIVMWFDNYFMNIFGKHGWDVARTIHYYEAWLATLAIIVWHFYFIIFNPDIYPMNLAWLKGTLTETEMEDEHPLELERIKEKEALAEAMQRTAPLPQPKSDDHTG
jgi:formate dehydrogenase gamma subunit